MFPDLKVSGLPERRKSVFFPASSDRGVGRLSIEVFLLASSQDERLADNSAADSDNKSLNFKVSPDFKKEFKGFAVSQGITMTDLLKEGFVLSKTKRQK